MRLSCNLVKERAIIGGALFIHRYALRAKAVATFIKARLKKLSTRFIKGEVKNE